MEQKDIAVQGIIYDEKSSYLRGPALAPPLIREMLHSHSSNSFAEDGTNIDNDYFYDIGDYEIDRYFEIEEYTLRHLKQYKRLITLGGDHSITYPVLKAYNKHYQNIQILHIDAHADLYHEFEGDPYSHACPFARIMEERLTSRLVQVGIRTLSDHQREQIQKFGVEIHTMQNLEISSIAPFSGLVYISLDLDALDPAFAPGVSHHEPGGMTTREVIQLIHQIDAPIIGADIVEYNPKRDIHGITAAVAAKLLKEILAMMKVR